ncbi:hypothetical protein [Clostridium sp. BJN0001]|uniref:hypothetical protein n=1 Tax=Clostridium sp. BJN0001 TaxID=2930219 RepID=UPI001FD00234|nr:hypothetical protein [Clostridium sp. BJN0001]
MVQDNFFVRLQCKNINDVRSLIIQKHEGIKKKSGKYIMCSGKHNKEGWTLIFNVKSSKEAEMIADLNPYINKVNESLRV